MMQLKCGVAYVCESSQNAPSTFHSFLEDKEKHGEYW